MLVLLHHVFALLVVHFFKVTLSLREKTDPACTQLAVSIGTRLLFLSGHFFRRVAPHQFVFEREKKLIPTWVALSCRSTDKLPINSL